MIRETFKNQSGITLTELLIVIAIIGMISVVFMVNIRLSTEERIEAATGKLAADIRYIRNLAVSRTEYQFAGQAAEDVTYPPGGYGILFDDLASTARYIIYADSGDAGYDQFSDEMIATVLLDDIRINDPNHTRSQFYFVFYTENQVNTNMGTNNNSQYVVELREDLATWGTGYMGSLMLGEDSEDDYTWSNVGVEYGTFYIAKPDDPDEDPPEMYFM